jgi:hypothetical protein
MSRSGSAAAEDQARLEQTVAARRAELAAISRAASPPAWAAAQVRLGTALLELAEHCHTAGEAEVYRRYDQPRSALQAALDEAGQLSPADRATVRMQLSTLLGSAGVEMCRRALADLSPETSPELWAAAQRYLAKNLLQPIRGNEHQPRDAKLDGTTEQLEEAVQAARAAASVLSANAARRRSQMTLIDALTALGKQRSDAGLLDEAIALGRDAARQPTAESSWREVVDAHAALGNALLARARLAGDDPALLREAVGAHRAALMTAYHAIGSFRSLACRPLGTALQAAGLGAAAAGDNPSAPLSWALDALATATAVSSQQGAQAAMGTLAAMKTVAARQDNPRLWEAWAAAVTNVGTRLGGGAPRDLLFQELGECLDAHGTADMRLLWAHGAAPTRNDARPIQRQLQILAEIRALADRQHDEPALRLAWAKGASTLVGKLVESDVANAARGLDDLRACAGAADAPEIWTMWAQAACECLAKPAYVAAGLQRARSELADAKARLDRLRSPWPGAAATVHDVLVARDEAAAGALRDEIKAFAQAGQDDTPWEAWTDATVGAIKQIRSTDYPKARELLAELTPVAGRLGYRGKRAVTTAKGLLQDREVKRAAGLIREVLEPLTLPAEATGTGDGLRVSRLDASKAPNLATVGRGIHCRELILTGTAVATLPDDIEVVQRLDISACSRLTRLPAGLKVGQLIARDCVALAALPAGLRVSYLDLTGCTSLAALPADLVVRNGRLSLRGCVRLRALPPGIGPLGQLDLAGCLNITAVPPTLAVTAWIDVGGSGLTALPPHLAGVAIRWRGVLIDERIAFRPETLDAGEILAEPNAERRRVMMERCGLDRFMRDANALVLDQDRDAGGPRRLLRIELPGDEPLVCVSVICPSTRRQYMLRVPPTMQTCRQAVAWTAGFEDSDDYRPTVET